MPAKRNAIHVVVVDDDRRIHQALEDLFALSGYVVRGAYNGEEALDDLQRRPAAALITELALPGLDGLTLIRQARQLDPSLATLVLTAAPSARAASRALRAGCDDFLIKHADSITHLRDAVKRAIRRRARQAETERLLAEMAELNEVFLKNMVALQKENLDLEARLTPPTMASARWRVLVVDDDPSIVRLLQAALEGEPAIEVTGVYSGGEAERALEASGPFDLVMTDKNLGDANGVELVQRITEETPDTAVLLMTGFATLDSAVQAMDHGAVAYLRKPFDDIDVVLQKVREVRERQRESRKRTDYLHEFKRRNSDFIGRYQLIKTKLLTLQRESS